MKIIVGDMQMEVLSAFEDHLYQQDQSRPALRLRLAQPLTQEAAAALPGGAIILQDNGGEQIGTFEGYNAVHECTVTLIKENAGQETETLKMQLDQALAQLDEMKAQTAELTDTSEKTESI